MRSLDTTLEACVALACGIRAVECCSVVRAGPYLDGLNGDGQLDVLVVFGQLVLGRPVSGGPGGESSRGRTLSGSLRKWPDMGRPLQSVSQANGSGGYAVYSAGPGTHVLSFAAFKLSRNFSPISVVDAAVSPPSSASVCPRSPCQHCPQTPQAISLWDMYARVGGARGVGGGVEGQRKVKVARSSNQVRRRALPIHRPQPSRIPHATVSPNRTEPRPTPPRPIFTTRGARTGSFWRFDGRPSFSGAAAPDALRFAALSISDFRRRVDSRNN
jgi:hypothetical protein